MSRNTGSLIDITLAQRHEIWSHQYVASATYIGFLERTPSEACNECTLADTKREAERFFPGVPVHIIKPPRSPGEIDYPQFSITAHFTSLPINAKFMLSCLTVVWFQDSIAQIPDPAALNAIKAIDWAHLALDYDV